MVRYNFLTILIYLQMHFGLNYFYFLKRILGIKRTHYRFHLLDKEEEEEEAEGGFLTLSEGEDEEGEDEEDSEGEDGPVGN